MDDFMKQFLAYLERIATAVESIAANGGGGFVASTATPAGKADTKAADDKAAAEAKAKADKIAAAEAKVAADVKAAEEAAKGPVYTLDEVRAALKEYRAIEGAPAMLEVLKVHGGKEALTEVDPKDFAAIMTAVGAAKAE